MKKLIKIVGGSLAVLAVGVGVTAVAAVFLSERKMNRVVDVPISSLDLASLNATMERGEYLFTTRGCSECHGDNGGGRLMIDDESTGFYVFTPNITRGGGGAAAAYSDTDWIALVRHGLKPSHVPVLIMPSEDYAQMADQDVASLVGYIRSLPPAPERKAEIRLPVLMKALYAFGAIRDAAEKIDHQRPAPTQVPESLHEQGKYVANTCTGCHGQGLTGGKVPGGPPSWPEAANLTGATDSAMARYASPEMFRQMMRTGKRPDGTTISVMPFESLARMSDTELDAVYGFLKGLPAKDSGTR
jgi:mono/diheme cytochrome c family protein